MAENDEYQFVDPDAFDPSDTVATASISGPQKSGMVSPPNIKRNALMAVITLLLSISIYHYITHRHKPSSSNLIQPIKRTIQQPQVEPQNILTEPVTKPETADNDKIDQTLSLVQDTQQNMQSDLSGINEHVTRVDERLSAIMTTVESLTQRIEQLSNTLDVEAQRMEHALTTRAQHINKKSATKLHPRQNQITNYNVEAVIPGRAWLIGSNGTTITVSVGTPIAGYGRVRVIDAPQGRVLTSSGKIMRFSQDDS